MYRLIYFVVLTLCITECLAQSAPNIFVQPPVAILGPGCTTMFYTDALCKPCGTGMKSAGNPINIGYWNSSTAYTTGMWVTYAGDSTYPNRSYWEATTGNTDSAPAGSGGVSTNSNWTESPTPYAGYAIVQNPAGAGVPAYYSMGDTPDADPNSATICTTAEWQAKWGSNNAAMVSYLNDDFDGGFANTGSIYYVSLTPVTAICTATPTNTGCTFTSWSGGAMSGATVYLSTGQWISGASITSGGIATWSATVTGSPTTAILGVSVVNDPAHPYMTLAPIFTALDTTVAQSACGTVETTISSYIVTVVTASGCTLKRSALFTASGIPANAFVVQQVSGTPGGTGTYLLTKEATATHGTAESLTTGYQPGGVVVIDAGQWLGCSSATPTSGCLSFQPADGGNPNWEPSGSPGNPLLIMSYPGAVVAVTSTGQGGNMFQMNAGVNPTTAACCFTVDALEFPDAKYDQGYLGVFVSFTDVTLERNEWAGWDNIQFANGTANDVLRWNVGHDIYAHFLYNDWDVGCALTNPGVDTNFGQDQLNVIAGTSCGAAYNVAALGNVVYDCGYQGYDCLHFNGWGLGQLAIGNIIAYSGYPIAIVTGQYGLDANNNLMFDDASECVLIWDYTNYYGLATFGSGSTSITLTVPPLPGSSTTWPATTMYVYGTNLPSGPPPSGATLTSSGGNVAGTYTLSQPTLGAATNEPVSMGGNNGASNNSGPSTLRYETVRNNVCEQGNPSDLIYGGNPGYGIRVYESTGTTYIKNISLLNNTIQTYNSDSGVGQMPLSFLVGSAQSGGSYTQPTTAGDFPETDTITANTFFNSDTGHCSSNCNIMNLDAGASQTIAGGTYTFSGSGQFSSYFSGNTYASSTPFPNCPESYAQTPWLCTFPASLWH